MINEEPTAPARFINQAVKLRSGRTPIWCHVLVDGEKCALPAGHTIAHSPLNGPNAISAEERARAWAEWDEAQS